VSFDLTSGGVDSSFHWYLQARFAFQVTRIAATHSHVEQQARNFNTEVNSSSFQSTLLFEGLLQTLCQTSISIWRLNVPGKLREEIQMPPLNIED